MFPETSTPDGLTSDVPRAVQFTASTEAARLFLFLSVVLVAYSLGWLHVRDISTLNALKAHGRTTLARVIGKHSTQGKSISYSLEYDFIVGSDWVYGDENVSEDVYAETRNGAALPVTFLPSHPETYERGTVTQERIQARQSAWLWGETWAFAFFGLLLLGMEATLRRHLLLLRGGTAVAGTVTDRSMDPARKEFSVTYEFTVDGRFAVERRSHSKKVICNRSFHELMETGRALTVLYNPARPSQSIPYRMLTDVTLGKS